MLHNFPLTCFVCICMWGSSPVSGRSISSHSLDNEIAKNAVHTPPVRVTELNDFPFALSGKIGADNKNRANNRESFYSHSVNTAYPSLSIPSTHFRGNTKSSLRTTRIKRTPTGFTARGFHENIFDRDFGHFSPVKRTQKRRPEANAAGFYGDTFSNGFGEFETMKRDPQYLTENEIDQIIKRRPMGATGFHGDTFAQGFGEFDTMKRRFPNNNWIEASKRKPEMTKSGFHGDVFNGGFGEFHPNEVTDFMDGHF